MSLRAACEIGIGWGVRSTRGVGAWAGFQFAGTLAAARDTLGGRARSVRRRVPQLLTWIRYPPKVRSTPDRRSVKVDLRIGRCAMKPRDSNRSDSAQAMSMIAGNGTSEIVAPTCF